VCSVVRPWHRYSPLAWAARRWWQRLGRARLGTWLRLKQSRHELPHTPLIERDGRVTFVDGQNVANPVLRLEHAVA
jgi:hypothetical protein